MIKVVTGRILNLAGMEAGVVMAEVVMAGVVTVGMVVVMGMAAEAVVGVVAIMAAVRTIRPAGRCPRLDGWGAA